MSGRSTSSRDALIAAVLDFVGHDVLSLSDVRTALEAEVDEAGDAALVTLKARMVADRGWDYSPGDPLVQRIHHRLADRFLKPDSQVLGVEHLATVADVPVVLFSNHLSYADANVIEGLLYRSGGSAMADRMTVVAGPKVFTSRERRFASLCFGTVRAPQSTDVSSEEAVLNARDVARAARQSIDVALERLAAGDALVLFGEGTRSRSGGMQPLLPAVARYLDQPGIWVLPVGLSGTESIFPIDKPALAPATVVMHIGRPFRADALLADVGGDRRAAVDAIGRAIAELLPPAYRGVYDSGSAPQHSES